MDMKTLMNIELLKMKFAHRTPKTAAEVFYNGEVELRRIGYSGYVFRNDSDRELCIETIEKVRRDNIYSHLPGDCTRERKLRGKIVNTI